MPIQKISSLFGTTEVQRYASGKKSLVIAVKKSLKLEVCKPSAASQDMNKSKPTLKLGKFGIKHLRNLKNESKIYQKELK